MLLVIRLGSGHVLLGDADFVGVVELRQHDPGREDADEQDAKVETNADKVVGITLGLHAVMDNVSIVVFHISRLGWW